MKITKSDLIQIIREARSIFDKKGPAAKKATEPVTGLSSTEMDQLEKDISDYQRIAGGKRGTRQYSGNPTIRRWKILSSHQGRAVKAGTRRAIKWDIPYRGVEHAVAILFKNGVSGMQKVEPLSYRSSSRATIGMSTIWDPGMLGGAYGIQGSTDTIQFNYVSPEEQKQIFELFIDAKTDPQVKDRIERMAANIDAGSEDPGDIPLADLVRAQSASMTARPLAQKKKKAAEPPAPPSGAVNADKVSNAVTQIKRQSKSPADLRYWIGLVARAATGKIGTDAQFLRPVLGFNFKDTWNATELESLKSELLKK